MTIQGMKTSFLLVNNSKNTNQTNKIKKSKTDFADKTLERLALLNLQQVDFINSISSMIKGNLSEIFFGQKSDTFVYHFIFE